MLSRTPPRGKNRAPQLSTATSQPQHGACVAQQHAATVWKPWWQWRRRALQLCGVAHEQGICLWFQDQQQALVAAPAAGLPQTAAATLP